jgi:hypothetical protein
MFGLRYAQLIGVVESAARDGNKNTQKRERILKRAANWAHTARGTSLLGAGIRAVDAMASLCRGPLGRAYKKREQGRMGPISNGRSRTGGLT